MILVYIFFVDELENEIKEVLENINVQAVELDVVKSRLRKNEAKIESIKDTMQCKFPDFNTFYIFCVFNMEYVCSYFNNCVFHFLDKGLSRDTSCFEILNLIFYSSLYISGYLHYRWAALLVSL